MIIDSHAHIDLPVFNGDRDQVLARARSQGVVSIVNVGLDLKSSRISLNIAKRYPEVFTAVGFHPTVASKMREGDLSLLSELTEDSKVVAIGEIGLEPSSQTCPDLAIQEEIFKAQLGIAKDHNVPVVIHTPFLEKEKWIEKYASLIDDAKLDKSKVLLDHANASVVKLIWDIGYLAGISVQPWRNVTPVEAAKVVEAKENLDQLMIDSDCASPLPSDPLSVPKAVLEMRKLGIKDADIKKVVLENPTRFFNLPS